MTLVAFSYSFVRCFGLEQEQNFSVKCVRYLINVQLKLFINGVKRLC